jgi:hypothetical protein
MAADLCYYRFYPQEYLGSPIICRMTLEEQGAHQRLLAHGWRMDGIPADRREIATLLGLEPGTERAERIITRVLDLAWKPDPDQPRTLRNDDQETQRRQAQTAYKKQCASIAKARLRNAKNVEGLKSELSPDLTPDLKSDLKTELQFSNSVIQETHVQKTDMSATSADVPTTRIAIPPPLETQTANQLPGKPKRPPPGPDPAFDEFRRHYPKGPNHSWAKARILWDRNTRKGVHPDAMIAGGTLYKAHCVREGLEPRFIKHPETFLGEGRWWEADYGPPEDEGGDLPTYLSDGSINPVLQRLLGGRRS